MLEEVIKDGFAIANEFVGDGTHKTTLQMWEQKLLEDKELAAQTLMSAGKSLQKMGEFLQAVQPKQVEPIMITARPLVILPREFVDPAPQSSASEQPVEVAAPVAPQPNGEASTPLQNP